MSYSYLKRKQDLNSDQVISIIIAIIIFIIVFFFAKKLKDKHIQNKKFSNNPNNPKAVAAVAQSLGANYKEKFKQAIKDIEKIDALNYFFYPEFTNVLEKENEDGSKIYIGDLEWSKSYEFIGGGENKYKQYTTVCICYDNNFNLPHFDLVKETIEKKAYELLKLEATEDIDFIDDKEFSDSWWLASSENVLVRELFDKKVRKAFMCFVERDYIICGRQNNIIIMTGKIVNPNSYKYIISEMNKIQQTFKENGKFYYKHKEKT